MSEEEDYRKLPEKEIQQEVARLDGWKVVNGKINKSFEFDNFVQAFGKARPLACNRL
jgi:pterin-4a-carbinolamine dehydratase